MHLSKHQSMGNDFLITFVPELPADREPGDLARRWCHRRRGIGADGLIFVTPVSQRSSHRAGTADMRMHLFNSDGSEAEISGNGIRCLAQAEALRRGTTHCVLTIASAGGDREVDVTGFVDDRTALVSVDMGAPKPGPAIPSEVIATVPGRVGSVDLGNPHLVVEVRDPDSVVLAKEGPELERHFPGGINVHFVRQDRDGHIDMRVWERGAGATDSCGSGACAAASVVRLWEPGSRIVKVRMPGGEAEITLDEAVTLSGPVSWVGDVEVLL
ncbi:MAG: Diaminopimelate epimerase [Acidimicrobiales bacterium]|nr:MAG: diaminopimelate epimerase [Actinomycetota bacterium]MBV6509144.1 Diaminopimelate epimerase [Acidimicrobiales bacterium]RIK08507.1 MAG: diaminopimelate epimerase [Acidobacteriota bacterium]